MNFFFGGTVAMKTISQMLRDKEASNPARQITGACPFCGGTIVSNAILCLRCKRDLRTGKRLGQDPVASNFMSRWLTALLLAALIGAIVYYIGWIRGTSSDPFQRNRTPAREEVQPIQARQASRSVQHQPAASKKYVRKQVDCPKCKGLGYTLTSFGQSKLKCLNCQGSGFVTRTVRAEQ